MPNPPRPRVPEYPRPVAYVCTDEAPICPDTVVFEQWTDEAEEEARKRAAKRRRVRQEAADCYLREQPVFILSATLKGPFEDGWKNPWARKRQRQDAEIRETTAKEALWRKSLMAAAVKADKSVVIDPTPAHKQPLLSRDEEQKNVFNARSHSVQPEDPPSRRSAKKVEDWLRKTEDQGRSRQIDLPSSPTPAVNPYFKVPTAGGYDNPFVIPEDDGPTPVQQPKDETKGRGTNGVPSRSPSAEPSQESPRRAELAILEHKRQSVHRIPPSTHLPEFEYRRPRSRGQQSTKAHTSAREESAAAVVPDPRAPEASKIESNGQDLMGAAGKSTIAASDEKSTSRPDLSTETSKASTVQHNLPSAQVVAAPNLVAMPSNAQSTEDMLHSVPPVSSKEALAEPDPSEMQQAAQEAEKENQPGSHITVEPVPEAVEAPAASLEKTPVRELETQEMIAAIKPFDFSTIKKPSKSVEERATPVTVTKAKKAKEKKKASFALSSPSSDGSQRSITAGMKITKAASRPVLGKTSPKKGVFGSLDSHVDAFCGDSGKESVVEDSLPSVSAMFGPKKMDPPKSILKSSAVHSTAPMPTATNTTSTSAKQDAQQVSEAPAPLVGAAGAVDEDDSFDLDGAMDELGSYLGTWDPDVEANKLAS